MFREQRRTEDCDQFFRMDDDVQRLSMADEEDKIGFIRKVYGIIFTQLLITAFATLLPYLFPSWRMFMLHHPTLVLLCAFGAFFISCCLFCVTRMARTVPMNYILMFVFTACEAYTVSYICAAVNSPQVVISAAFMTAGIVLGLTVYAYTTETDFTVYGALAFVLGAAFLIFGIFSFLFGPTMRLVYCVIGVVLFGFYLIMDTQMIIGGGKYELDRDDYILGAIILYLDIVNIFLYLVKILSAVFGNKDN